MNAPSRDTLRRGWCPSTLKPMETGDGWLVRLHPPGAQLTPAQLRRLAALAAQHGNGLIEISARGNMQLRGVTAESHPELVATLLAERLVDEHEGDGPQRLTLVSPLAFLPRHCDERSDEAIHAASRASGLDCFASLAMTRSSVQPPSSPPGPGDLIDALSLAAEIEACGRAIAGLPAKFAVVVDGGGESSLDGFAGDIRLVATAPDQVVIALADRLWFGPVAEGDAGATVAQTMARFAARRAQAPDTIRRMGDLAAGELAALCDLPATEPPPQRPAPRRAGLFALHASHAALVALPFGRADAATLDRLAQAAKTLGCPEIRLSPWRGIAFRGLSQPDASTLLDGAAADGLITRDDDPRLSVQACAGSPACQRGEVPAMADAARLAQALAPDLAEGLTLHVSGCVKSCARPAASDLTLVGEGGRYRIVIGGGTRDSAVATLDLSALLTRLQPAQDLHARLIAAGRLFRTDRVTTGYDYIRDGGAIYERSFAIIRAEADLSRFAGRAAHVVVRMIHACGMTDLPDDVEMSPDFADAAEAALKAGAPILCDAKMVANGVTPSRLPARNPVICTLDDPRTAPLAAEMGTTRSAAAMELWRPNLAGAVVVIGNAPTSLFRLLEMLDAGAPKPAAVIGIPVGFVGAAESKQALADDGRVPFLVVHGRRGGSAMAAAAVNALAQEKE